MATIELDQFSSADLNPIAFPEAWSYVTIAGRNSPGIISPDGLKGFERGTEWDEKKGKGAQGATLTLTQYPPAKGSIEFLLWLAEHFTQWESFRPLLKYNTAKKSGDAFSIYHPALADLDINAVVTNSIGPITYKGKGLYSCTVKLIEWFPPPAASIVSTPSRAKPNDAPKPIGETPDPVSDALQKRIAELLAQASQP
jgi:hypothetical protein